MLHFLQTNKNRAMGHNYEQTNNQYAASYSDQIAQENGLSH